MVREEVFSPIEADNIASYDCCIWLASDFAATIILEMCDPKKVTQDYLTATDGKYCMTNTSAAEKGLLMVFEQIMTHLKVTLQPLVILLQ